MNSEKLKQFTSRGGEWVVDLPSGFEVLHVRTPHLLLQAAGYLKHTLAKNKPMTVLFRGQPELYPTLLPSLYRGATTARTKSKRDQLLRQHLDKIEEEKKIMRAVPSYAREAVLQHYGIRTRYLDVVDNVWVALWFACHAAVTAGKRNDFLHFERRRIRPVSTPAAALPPSGGIASAGVQDKKFAYVLLVAAGSVPYDNRRAGVFVGDSGTELVDLRVAVPSQFLRPHAQHGLVVRRAKHNDYTHMDCSDFVVGVLRVDLADAFDWLGSGSLVTIHSLFPPAAYDSGYREILEGGPVAPLLLGAIHKVGA